MALTRIQQLIVIVTVASVAVAIEGEGNEIRTAPPASLEDKFCGKIEVSGRTVKLFEGRSLTPAEFQNVRTLWGARFVPETGCAINVCGSTIFGPESSYSDCEQVTENTLMDTQIYNEEFNTSSLSCGCKKREYDCMFTCEIREKLYYWNASRNACAVFFQEKDCNTCYFPAIFLSDGQNFTADNAHQVDTLMVRDNCRVQQGDPDRSGSSRWVDPADGAFMSESATFHCGCGEMANGVPPETERKPNEKGDSWSIRFKSDNDTVAPLGERASGGEDGSSLNVGVIVASAGGVLIIIVAVGLLHWKLGQFSGMRKRGNHPDVEIAPSLASDAEFLAKTAEKTSVSSGNVNEAQEESDDGTGADFTNFKTESSISEGPLSSSSSLKLEILDEVKKLMEPFFVTMGPDWSKNVWSSREVVDTPDYDVLSQEFSRVCRGEYIIPRIAFKIPAWNLEKPLGSGKFGVVYKGVLKNDGDGLWEEVAVKKMQGKTDSESFLREIKNFQSVGGRDENIVKFIGACCDTDGLFLLTELCEGGSLEKYLLNTMRPRLYGIVPPNVKMIQLEDDYFTTDIVAEQRWIEERQRALESQELRQLLVWCQQIAAGMQYLHETVNMLHVDLAVRNVLLRDGNAKIADFGLSRKCLGKEYFTQSVLHGELPFNSFAPELLPRAESNGRPINGKHNNDDSLLPSSGTENPVTIFLDIWAFGCLIWQMFRIGQDLYPDVKAERLERCVEITMLLANGYRHPKPRLAPDYMYDQMLACWNQDPRSRPRFSDLRAFFAERINDIDAD